jgi:hypothetical protein
MSQPSHHTTATTVSLLLAAFLTHSPEAGLKIWPVKWPMFVTDGESYSTKEYGILLSETGIRSGIPQVWNALKVSDKTFLGSTGWIYIF